MSLGQWEINEGYWCDPWPMRVKTKLFPLLSPPDLYFASHVLLGIVVTEVTQHSISYGSCFFGTSMPSYHLPVGMKCILYAGCP